MEPLIRISQPMCFQLNCRSGFTPRFQRKCVTRSRRKAAPANIGWAKILGILFGSKLPPKFRNAKRCVGGSLLPIIFLLAFLSNDLPAQMASPGHGETQSIALHPTDPNILYAGAAKGLCKTLEGGADGWPVYGLDSFSPRAIVVSKTNPDILYAGTCEMGVHKSDNAAKSWKAVNTGITDLRIRALVIHPSDNRIVYAGTEGTGIFKTVDGGQSWDEMNTGLVDKVIRTLVIDPENSDRLYAGTWHGVYSTVDGARTWSVDSQGIFDVDVRALALDPTNPKILYAGTQPRGIYRSADRGKTWVAGAEPLTEFIESMAIDPANPSHVYVGTKAGVFLSTDRGDHFTSAGLRWSNQAWTLVFDPKTSPPTLYYGGVGGVLKTINQGHWWEVTGPKHK
jgi:photosystem II stability/assembly factor-like uncharacterized protein